MPAEIIKLTISILGGFLAIRAVISRGEPSIDGKWTELWFGELGATEDGEETGVTTAAVLAFLKDAQPGAWYALPDFDKLVRSTDWTSESTSWTSLTLSEDGIKPTAFVTDIKLSDAVSSVCREACALLSSLEETNVWVRFE